MAIPRKNREDIIAALTIFDNKLRHTPEWQSWETRGSQSWGLEHEGKVYPPKQIISLAANIPVGEFSGGPESNSYLNNLGFTVKRLRKGSLHEIFKTILEEYSTARETQPFAGRHNIYELFNESRRILQKFVEQGN